MSDVEKRQTQQRAVTIAACAAAFAVGGPLVGHRFEAQKSDEAYRAETARLATQLAATQADWRAPPVVVDDAGVVRANFTNYTDDSQSRFLGELNLAPVRDRDAQAIASFISFTPSIFGAAEQEQSELDCLADAIYYEARSESARGQMAVAEVVMNRVHDSRFPNTVCDVVFQGRYRQTGCQFTFTCDGSLRRTPRGAAWDRARAVALHVQLGLNKPVTNKATHYHTDYVNPYWSAGLVTTGVVGQHIFYRFPKTGSEWTQARLALAAQDQHNATVDMLEADALAEETLKLFKAEASPAPVAPPKASVVAISASADDAIVAVDRAREL